jgi:hypothetical protein
VRLAFNSGMTVVSVGCAWWTFAGLGGSAGMAVRGGAIPLAAAAAVHFLTNVLLVSAPIAVERGERFLVALFRVGGWSAPLAVAGFFLSWGTVVLVRASSVWALLVIVIPCWLAAFFYRVLVTREETLGLS